MKKTFAYILIPLFALGTLTAFAEEPATGTTTKTQAERKAELQQKMDEQKAKLEEKKTEMQQKLEDRKATIQQNVDARKAEIETKKAEIQQRIDTRKAEIEQKKEDIKQKLSERRQQVITAYGERMEKRLYAALDRLSKLADRIDSRVAKLDPKKFDTTTATNKIAEARAQIEILKTEIAALSTSLEEVTVSDDPQSTFAATKTDIEAVKNKIKAVHTLLVEAVASLRAQVTQKNAEEMGDATTTATSTGTTGS